MPNPLASLPAAQPAAHPDGRGTVLVVDDEESIRTIVPRLLLKLGYETVTCRDGLEAMEVFRRDPDRFRFVLMDLTMPRLDGAGALAEIRQIRRQQPVIVMSGYNSDDSKARLAPLGSSYFLQKPFGLAELSRAIASLRD